MKGNQLQIISGKNKQNQADYQKTTSITSSSSWLSSLSKLNDYDDDD